MGIQSPAEVAKEAETLKKQSQKVIDEAKKVLGEYKTHCGEFETIRGGLLEGSDMIVAHVKELVTMFATFDKMTIKLDLIRKDLINDGKSLRALDKPLLQSVADARELVKDADKLIPINKGNSLLVTAKTSTQALDKTICELREKMGVAASDCEGLPGPVARPKGL